MVHILLEREKLHCSVTAMVYLCICVSVWVYDSLFTGVHVASEGWDTALYDSECVRVSTFYKL